MVKVQVLAQNLFFCSFLCLPTVSAFGGKKQPVPNEMRETKERAPRPRSSNESRHFNKALSPGLPFVLLNGLFLLS